MNEEDLDRQASLEFDDESKPWQFLEHLRMGRVIQLPSVIVPIVQLEPLYVWDAQKIVYPVPEQLHGQDLVLKMYRARQLKINRLHMRLKTLLLLFILLQF